VPDPARTVVIGTAGHVDHGKSSLVKALTGTDPDRLAEEKARGLTIDLGFAWVRLPTGDVASFVDVPGHEDFVRNMLAGAGGVSACLLVVAADEGPMPQTREHLAILDLLGLRHGVVALTKADLVDDDWLALVTAEVASLLAGTGLAEAPVLPVSATTGAGLPTLVTALADLVARVPDAIDHHRPRLSIDRAFSLAGFGTVVTGTLRDGTLRPGDPVVLLPAGQRLRARTIHSHGQATDEARPGTRTAVNLPGVETAAIARGNVLAAPDTYQPTRLLDVLVTVLATAPVSVAHDDRLHVFQGAAEIPARLRMVGGRAIAPGESGFAQLRLAQPAVMAVGDRLVLRRPTPADTIGGARVLDPRPRGRRRRFRPETLARFAALSTGAPDEVAWHMLAERDPCRANALAEPDTGLAAGARDSALARLAKAGRVKDLGAWWVTDARWGQLRARAEAVLGRYHQRQPLRAGAPPEELRERLGLAPDAFAAVVAGAVAEGWLARDGDAVRLAGHRVRFGADQQARAAALMARFRAAPYAPPSAKDAEALAGVDVVASLVARGDLVAVASDVLFDHAAYDALVAGVTEHILAHGAITVAEVRDRFDTSRKYALALLEHLDRARVTRRVGDARVLARPHGADGGMGP
jgi:selenocysteine-specific elongation factor